MHPVAPRNMNAFLRVWCDSIGGSGEKPPRYVKKEITTRSELCLTRLPDSMARAPQRIFLNLSTTWEKMRTVSIAPEPGADTITNTYTHFIPIERRKGSGKEKKFSLELFEP